MRKMTGVLAALSLAVVGLAQAGEGQVRVTPLGSHDGEFCSLDRALVFEDPDGTRILYDAGRTVRGPDDPRLGRIDAVLLSHVHADHLGDLIQPSANAGECGKPDFSVKVTPTSNTVNIVVGKKAKFLVGSEMGSFFANRVKEAGGDAQQVQLVRFGASAKVGGVQVTTVPAAHSNGLHPAFLDQAHGDALAKSGLTAYVGPPTGYVLRFSNGLVAYLSGDTGITAEQDLVVRGYYRANLVVINIGDVFTTGPAEAAYVVNELVKPASVIASHANQPSTQKGRLLPESRAAAFKQASKVPTHLPLSGVAMAFDGKGSCVTGC